MIVIEPRPGRPFPLDVVAGAGEEHPAVGLSTGIHACGRGICMIRNCRYDIDFCLDRGVIVSNPVEWELLQERFFIPRTTDTVKTSPRNRILLCKNHRALFDSEYFFIRYHQETKKYYFVNCSGKSCLDSFHGLPCLVDPNSKYAPYPNLLLNHEGYVRYKWNRTGTTFTFKSPIMAPSHGHLSEVTLPLTLASSETHSVGESVRKMDKEDGSEDTDRSTSGDNDDGTDGFDSEGPPREMKSAIMGWLEDVSHPRVDSTQIASDDSE